MTQQFLFSNSNDFTNMLLTSQRSSIFFINTSTLRRVSNFHHHKNLRKKRVDFYKKVLKGD